jgi:hypothetical protein
MMDEMKSKLKTKLTEDATSRRLEIYVTPDKWTKVTVYQFTTIGSGEVVWRKAEVNFPSVIADADLAAKFSECLAEAARVAKEWDERAGKQVQL